jgi:uncharacterized protein YcbX
MNLGNIAQIFRYPVKSMGGETLASTEVGPDGLPGDRAWAVRDEVRGGIRGAKKIPQLMQLKASYPDEPGQTKSAPANIVLPDGSVAMTGDIDINDRLSSALGHEVSLWPLVAADMLDHYRRGAPDHEDFEQELREIFARTPDEPLPDLASFPPEILEYESPPGTYFDAFPILLMTQASLDGMQTAHAEGRYDARRFRPNFLIDETGAEQAFPETDWLGKRLQAGSVIFKTEIICPRCAMTTHGFDDLPRDPGIMRALVRETGGNLGLYASVEQAGRIEVGDSLTVIT